MSKADTIKPKDIKKVLKTVLLMRNSASKRCALVLSHSAMRVSEIARLETKTVLFPNGRIRDEIHLPAKICKSLKPRTIWITNPTTRLILQEFIDYRLLKKWGTSLESKNYQGLIANSKFLFNGNGKPFSLQPKKRKIKSGYKIYWCSDSLEQMLREIYKRCGLHNCSSHSGRKAFVSNAVIRSVSLEQLARILGHREISTTLQYVVIDQDRIKKMCGEDWI